MMDKDKIYSVLHSIGFNSNEIHVYLNLLSSGKASPSEVSKTTQIHRSNTYDILEKLHEKGIVDKSVENDKKYFSPIDPDDLLDYLKQKERELESIIPEMNKLQNTKVETERVFLSEGMNSVKNILNHLLDYNSPISSYGIPKESIEILGGFIEEFHRKRIKRKIPFRAVYDSKSISYVKKLNKMDFTEARFYPLKHPQVSTIVCSDRVITIIWNSPITVINILSERVAETYSDYFEILWKESEVNLE